VEQIQVTATLPKIASSDLGEFKQLAAQLLKRTKGETGALQYDWFLSADETKCVVRETYENSDAVLAHIANVGELLGKLAELGGGPSRSRASAPCPPQLAEAAAALQPTLYAFFQGK
jgi:quinol monooxygenase YgiN